MADGLSWCPGGGITIEEAFPYGFPRNNKRLIVAPTGVCDPTMSDTRERLAPFRVSTAFFRGTIAGLGSPILFTQPQAPLLFTAGPTDSAAQAGGGATGILARSDTNAQSLSDGGGAVRSGQVFVATGLWFQWLEPWTVPAGDNPIAGVGNLRSFPAFLRSPVSPYNKVILQALSSVLNPQLKNGKQTACDFDGLSLDVWPSGSSIADAKIGFGGIGGSFMHLAVPEVSGGQGSGSELQISLVMDRNLSIGNDAANATQAGVDVIAAVRAVVVGYPICAMPSGAVDYDQLAAAMVRQNARKLGGVAVADDPAVIDYEYLAEVMAKKAASGRR